ncbi:MAG: hypothetical protein LBT00_05305 [Spirochaetaceae bacterium]|nr:hypothetical protein [Spirochaetaceae bacterium]
MGLSHHDTPRPPFGGRHAPPVIAEPNPPSLRASGTLPGEAIQQTTPFVWIASPFGFAMTMPATRPAMTMVPASLRPSPPVIASEAKQSSVTASPV